MTFATALGIDYNSTGTMISLVGGGGKTSSIFTLAEELAGYEKKVLITTTTAMYNPVDISTPNIFILGDHITDEGKLKGILKEQVNQIYEKKIYDYILVEADGSRGKPIKAPGKHEPVVPEATDIMIGVIGIESYGKEVTSSFVHRPEIFAELTENYDGVIDDNTILKLISQPEGLFKNCPKEAKKVLLLNKVLEKTSKDIAIKIGHKVLDYYKEVDRVLVGAVKEDEPIQVIIKR